MTGAEHVHSPEGADALHRTLMARRGFFGEVISRGSSAPAIAIGRALQAPDVCDGRPASAEPATRSRPV